MTTRPASGHISNSARTQSEVKTDLEAIVSLLGESIEGAKVAKTLATDAIPLANNEGNAMVIDTEGGAATDDLRNIGSGTRNLNDGDMFLVQCANAARNVRLFNANGGAGQILTQDGAHCTLTDPKQWVLLKYKLSTTTYEEVYRSQNIDAVPISVAANTALMGPNGAPGKPSYRTIVGTDLEQNNIIQRIAGYKAASTITISASDDITPAASQGHIITLSANSGTTDSLSFIQDTNLVDGAHYRLVATAGHTISIKHLASGAAGSQRQINLSDGIDRILSGANSILVYKNGNTFYEATAWVSPNSKSSFDPKNYELGFAGGSSASATSIYGSGYMSGGVSTAGTLTNVGGASNKALKLATAAAISAIASWAATSGVSFGGILGIHHFRIRPSSGNVTNQRLWVGYFGQLASTVATLDTLGAVGMGFRFSTVAGDTTFKCCAFGSAQTTVDSGVTVVDNTIYDLTIDSRTSGHIFFYINGVLVADITAATALPTGATQMFPEITMFSVTAAVHSFDFMRYYGEIAS